MKFISNILGRLRNTLTPEEENEGSNRIESQVCRVELCIQLFTLEFYRTVGGRHDLRAGALERLFMSWGSGTIIYALIGYVSLFSKRNGELEAGGLH